MITTTYARYELLRTLRNTRFFLFSLVFPLVLFLLVAGPNRHAQLGGIPFPVYYMSGMAAWGTMAAVIAGGGRIAAERAVGWNRQLRLTPLSPSAYIRTKVLTGYMMAAASIVILYTAGSAVGVRLSVGRWATMTALILIGLVPFAALGIGLGHTLTVETMGPAMGGITSLLALLGGAWGPVAETGAMHTLVQARPSYWLVQAGRSAMGGGAWPLQGWLVVVCWTVATTALARRAYARDTARV
jgi:ABC-2 type transport system permease protein